MKKILLTLMLTAAAISHAGISIVSDLDDTIKITHSDHMLEAFGYGSVRQKAYVGMPELLDGSRSYINKLHLVSSSPMILLGNVKSMLTRNKIKYDGLTLNSNFKRPDHITYKVSAIKKIIDSSEDQFILIGDDVGQDPEIYDQIIQMYPGRILASYIHIVNARPVPASSELYYTSYELAVKEFIAGRMTKDAVTAVYDSLFKKKNLENVFPEFALCPQDGIHYAWLMDTEFSAEADLLSSNFVNYCKYKWKPDKSSKRSERSKARQSDNIIE